MAGIVYEDCWSCHGTGKNEHGNECEMCEGEGEIEVRDEEGDDDGNEE